MKISIDDLEMAVKWMRQNSLDVNSRIELQGAKCVFTLSSPDQDVVHITLFDTTNASLQPRITKEDYLKYNMEKK